MAAIPVTFEAQQPSTRRVRVSDNTDEIPYVADVIYVYKKDQEACKRSEEEDAPRRRPSKKKGEEDHRRFALISAWRLRLEVEKYMKEACPARCLDLPDVYIYDEPETGEIAHGVRTADSADLTPQTNTEDTQPKVSSDSDDDRHEKKHPKYRQYVAGIMGALKSLRFPMPLRGVRLPRRTSMARVRPFRNEQPNNNVRNSELSCDEEEVRVSNRDVDVHGTMNSIRLTSSGRSAQRHGFDSIGP
eukprot:TRINITY_DN74914_c0_g1_i1.p1 TRINITY_DN74914_c0_g1~~TRINITY_DN74914_c0_g1_i1.p1  ORF type:complete len:274 (+),score=21.30 TRINITY_DN74914_c0_g1_i1:90-824(+)